jgi:hypothetical protein
LTGSPISGVNYRTFLLTILFLLISYHFALNFARAGSYFLPQQDYTEGRAGLPYQYRILMVPIFKALLQFFNRIDVQNIFPNVPPFIATPRQPTYAMVTFVGFFCAMALFHQIARAAFDSDIEVFLSDLLFVVATYSVFILNPNLNFILPYYLPSLALTQLCTLLVHWRKWTLLILAFIVRTINRETSFLVVVFIACRILLGLKPCRVSALFAAAVLAAIWVIIKVILFFLVAGTAGEGGINVNCGRIAIAANGSENLLTILELA